MKSFILFIGYEPSLHDEIREFLKDQKGVAHFSDTAEGVISYMDSGKISTVVLNMQQLEDAAILRYINMNHQDTRVILMPGHQLKDAIPALASGRYELIHNPFRLEELLTLLR